MVVVDGTLSLLVHRELSLLDSNGSIHGTHLEQVERSFLQ